MDPIPLQPDQPPRTSPTSPPGDEDILSLAPDDPAPAIPTARPSLLAAQDEPCPNCGKNLPASAIVCTSCGYDMQAGRAHTPDIGIVEVEPPPIIPDLVKPVRAFKPWLIAGAIVSVAALIVGAWSQPPRPNLSQLGVTTAVLVLTAYQIILHTGTGVLGLFGAARLLDHRLGPIESAATRMFLNVSIFYLFANLRLPLGVQWLSSALAWPIALGAYWLATKAIFKRPSRETSLILACHLSVWAFMEVGVQVSVWLNSYAASVPGK